jgi:N-acetylated-alpha-linked acidic dipeptidase
MGYLGVEGSHSLEKFSSGVEMDVPDPESGVSAWKRTQANRILNGTTENRHDARSREDLRIGALGSGSDYSSFIDHLGIPSLNLGFGGEDRGGIYHSAYDDFYWYTHFSDSSFVYGRALAQAAGTSVLRLANADLLPFAFSNLAETVQGYVKDLRSLRDKRAEEIADRDKAIDEGLYRYTSDPRDPVIAPVREQPAPQLNFTPLLSAVDSLSHAAARYDSAYARAVAEGRSSVAIGVNHRLLQAERALTSAEGLKNRPWYTHLIYAPGFYTGYGVKTLPGVREAIEQGQWQDADSEIQRAAAALEREATLISGVTATLISA